MDIIITGRPPGFIGRNLIARLAEQGHTFRSCTVGAVYGEIRTKPPDAIVHLSAISGIPACEANPEGAIQVNVTDTAALLNYALFHNTRVILASSMAVFGGCNGGVVDEWSAPKPNSIYGITKYAMEQLGQHFHREYGLPVTVLRFGNVYGPHSWHKASVIAKWCRALVNNDPVAVDLALEPIVVHGGLQRRAFIHVDEVVDAIEAVLTADKKAVGSGQIYHIAGSTSHRIIDVATKLMALSPGKTSLVIEKSKGESAGLTYSIQAAWEYLGWEPLIPLDEGLKSTLEWFREEAKRRENLDSGQ